MHIYLQIYVDIYAEDPDFSMNKMDVIKCLVEYYNKLVKEIL